MKRTALHLCYLIPSALLIRFVGRFGVNVPVHDQWRLVPLFGKTADGTGGAG